jgi:ABC-type sugar transport system ATPase subunit
MMLELNEVLLAGEAHTVSGMAHEGLLTCLVGGTEQRRRRWLEAMMGFEPLGRGFISIDGEPLNPATTRELRSMMAFVPARLKTEGEVVVYEPPTVQDVFSLKANRRVAISNGILSEEVKRTGIEGDYAQWLAVAVLLDKPILLVESPPTGALDYLEWQAGTAGRTVIVATDDETIIARADTVIEL